MRVYRGSTDNLYCVLMFNSFSGQLKLLIQCPVYGMLCTVCWWVYMASRISEVPVIIAPTLVFSPCFGGHLFPAIVHLVLEYTTKQSTCLDWFCFLRLLVQLLQNDVFIH